MEFDFILNIESALAIGVFSLYINVNYGIKLWRGPQAAQNELGPSNNFFWTPFGVYNHPTKGFWPIFFWFGIHLGWPRRVFGRLLTPPMVFYIRGTPQGPQKTSESTWITKNH